MNDPQPLLTELEGAILSEIHHRSAGTAFKVRKAFQTSPSLEWSGSSGAVYPAIRRLSSQGLIRSEPQAMARKTNILSLTSDGVARLNAWIGDADRAGGLGLDPFRLRSGLWAHLPPNDRETGLKALLVVVRQGISDLEGYRSDLDRVEQRRVDLAISLQKARALWLEEELGQRLTD